MKTSRAVIIEQLKRMERHLGEIEERVNAEKAALNALRRKLQLEEQGQTSLLDN